MDKLAIDGKEARTIADAFAQVSARVLDYRVESDFLTDAQAKELEKVEDTLDSFVVLFRSYGIQLLGQKGAVAANKLKPTLDEARDLLKTITKIKRVLTITAAVVGLAVAVQVGNAAGVVKALAEAKKAYDGTPESKPA